VLFATVHKLQTDSGVEMAVHRAALRELGGQFYLMLAEYLYLRAHRMKRQSVMGKSNQLVRSPLCVWVCACVDVGGGGGGRVGVCGCTCMLLCGCVCGVCNGGGDRKRAGEAEEYGD